MTALMIIVGIFIYLVVGKVFTNVLVRFEVYNTDNSDDGFILILINIFYPLYILTKVVNFVGDVLTKILFEKDKDSNVQDNKKEKNTYSGMM